ncbi:hypothetical protein QBC35DRAFT_453902 [Podospora australis]|uniref:Uncharacterized protein n=1 Tax=Podospora australis TaxID=1536484 RepID=A0AAN7AGH0_9PEZI|nr:hypothetical protein QBC35DRAFT_453902 [Podospora australis]
MGVQYPATDRSEDASNESDETEIAQLKMSLIHLQDALNDMDDIIRRQQGTIQQQARIQAKATALKDLVKELDLQLRLQRRANQELNKALKIQNLKVTLNKQRVDRERVISEQKAQLDAAKLRQAPSASTVSQAPTTRPDDALAISELEEILAHQQSIIDEMERIIEEERSKQAQMRTSCRIILEQFQRKILVQQRTIKSLTATVRNQNRKFAALNHLRELREKLIVALRAECNSLETRLEAMRGYITRLCQTMFEPNQPEDPGSQDERITILVEFEQPKARFAAIRAVTDDQPEYKIRLKTWINAYHGAKWWFIVFLLQWFITHPDELTLAMALETPCPEDIEHIWEGDEKEEKLYLRLERVVEFAFARLKTMMAAIGFLERSLPDLRKQLGDKERLLEEHQQELARLNLPFCLEKNANRTLSKKIRARDSKILDLTNYIHHQESTISAFNQDRMCSTGVGPRGLTSAYSDPTGDGGWKGHKHKHQDNALKERATDSIKP